MNLNLNSQSEKSEQTDLPCPLATSVALLQRALERSWQADTSADPKNWSQDNPAWGQCAITACVVQDKLGGEILCSEAALPDGRKLSHYYNRLDDSEDSVLDLTKGQFPRGTVIPEGEPKAKTYATTRDYVLSLEATRIRYLILKERVELKLGSDSHF